jgi:DNA-binding NarL/FixJ family response regulator
MQPSQQPLRVVIAEDHPFFSQGLTGTLEQKANCRVLAQTERGDTLLPLLEEHRPDVVLLDINLPGKDGLQLSREIKATYPNMKVVLLTMYLPSELRIDVQDIAADAYILKNSGTETLLAALQMLQAGRKYIDPLIQQRTTVVADNFSQKARLSTREKEILQLLLSGLSNTEVAQKLFLSELTIKTHRKNIMAKLDAHNLAELMQRGRQS